MIRKFITSLGHIDPSSAHNRSEILPFLGHKEVKLPFLSHKTIKHSLPFLDQKSDAPDTPRPPIEFPFRRIIFSFFSNTSNIPLARLRLRYCSGILPTTSHPGRGHVDTARPQAFAAPPPARCGRAASAVATPVRLFSSLGFRVRGGVVRLCVRARCLR